MSKLKEYKENKHNVESLAAFLQSKPGRDFSEMLRILRTELTSDPQASELRICGRHDVFQKLDDLLFAATEYREARPRPSSQKAGAPKPHLSHLPN